MHLVSYTRLCTFISNNIKWAFKWITHILMDNTCPNFCSLYHFMTIHNLSILILVRHKIMILGVFISPYWIHRGINTEKIMRESERDKRANQVIWEEREIKKHMFFGGGWLGQLTRRPPEWSRSLPSFGLFFPRVGTGSWLGQRTHLPVLPSSSRWPPLPSCSLLHPPQGPPPAERVPAAALIAPLPPPPLTAWVESPPVIPLR